MLHRPTAGVVAWNPPTRVGARIVVWRRMSLPKHIAVFNIGGINFVDNLQVFHHINVGTSTVITLTEVAVDALTKIGVFIIWR